MMRNPFQFYLCCVLWGYEKYLAGDRDTFTDTFPPHAEGAD